MKLFSKLLTKITDYIDDTYQPNVEYVFEHKMCESTKVHLREISNNIIEQLELDSTVIEKVVFGYEEYQHYGHYEEVSKTVFINCRRSNEAYILIGSIAHELYHAKQLTETWLLNADYDEQEAEAFAVRQTDILMPEYAVLLENDFPSNF